MCIIVIFLRVCTYGGPLFINYSLIQRAFVESAQNLTQEISGWAQSLACNCQCPIHLVTTKLQFLLFLVQMYLTLFRIIEK